MVRIAGAALLVGSIAFATFAAEAKPKTRTEAKTATKSKSMLKASATKSKTKASKSKPSRTKAKAKANAKKVATAKRRSRSTGPATVKPPSTPAVAVASHHGDGRVKYGRDNLPPGFAWPATEPMLAAEKACEAEITNLGVTWEPAPPLGLIADPIAVPSLQIGGITYRPKWRDGPFTFDCQLVRTLAQMAPELRAIGVREVVFMGIYRNSNVRVHGTTKPILSRHALGLAMDIAEFVDETGRVANVEDDYLKGDLLLHAIEDTVNRSSKFRIVLTPGNDPLSHYDHFHIEASVDFTAFR